MAWECHFSKSSSLGLLLLQNTWDVWFYPMAYVFLLLNELWSEDKVKSNISKGV